MRAPVERDLRRTPAAWARLLRGVVVVVLTIAVGVSWAAPTASAWSYAGTGGSPGAVTATAPVQFGMLSQGGLGLQLTAFGNVGPTVRRSPATTGAQRVDIKYSLQIWTANGWAETATQVSRSTIQRGSHATRLPAPYIVPTRGPNHYYRMIELIVWYGAATGRMLGWAFLQPSATPDHVCLYRPCAATVGYVWAGG